MKIVIVEKEHFEGAFPVIKLFDKPGNEITVLTTAAMHRRFLDLFGNEANQYKWAILPQKGKLQFFYSLYKQLKAEKPDILYVNTISDNHLLYAAVVKRLPIKRKVMTVHDINCLFESKPSWNFREAIIHYGKKKLIKRINEFNVVSDTMVPYLQTKAGGKPTHNIPGAVFENRYSPQAIKDSLKVVVPGSLDKRRRDYEQVFDLARIADKENLRLQIILLGGLMDAYGKNILDRALRFESEYCKITTYQTHIVDQEVFDQQMDAAHFVFIPSVVNTNICGNIPETYGITKSSGNIFDVIKHAKPFIVPAVLTISPSLQSSCFKYNKVADLADFFKKMLSVSTEYEDWQKRALENSWNYTIKKVRERNSSLFDA
jgi:hypothetical protein